MNDGIFDGVGRGTRGYLRPCQWVVHETTQQNIPFMVDAKFVSFICISAGGGGGSGRLGSSTAASGGGGGSGSAVEFRARVPVSIFARYGINRYFVTIGAGGTGGAGQTTDNTNGNSGTSGGTTQVFFQDVPYGMPGGGYANYRLNPAPGNSGSGGTTTTGANGAAQTITYGGFPGQQGGQGRNADASVYPTTQSLFPANWGSMGGAGGTGKGFAGAATTLLPFSVVGWNSGSGGFTAGVWGTPGSNAEMDSRFIFDELFSLPYFPSDFSSLLRAGPGGGGGQGGDSANTVAGGNGGNGFRGSGGGGGGGSGVSPSGAGGAGGNGVVIVCWEYQ